jgi:hypothetical protein
MAALEAATQRARVCGRKEVHAEDAEVEVLFFSAISASPRETFFIFAR